MKILLADDHDLVRDAIGTLLISQDDSIELHVAEDLTSAFGKIRSNSAFDVIILDLRMPGMNGLLGARKMMETVKDTPVIIMSGQALTSDVQSAHKIGVKGFVPKTLAGKSLINAIRLVVSGETYFPVEMISGNKNDNQSGNIKLTVREAEVLGQLRQGNSNKEISGTLDIAETTVKLHMRSLSDKLSARNRTDIVIKAIDFGLV